MTKQIEIPEGFERFGRISIAGKLPKRTISLHGDLKRLKFSLDLYNSLLRKYYGVEVFINRRKKIILFAPSNDEITSCRLIKKENNSKNTLKSAYIFSSSFKNEGLKAGVYPVRLNLGKIEFNYEKAILEEEK